MNFAQKLAMYRQQTRLPQTVLADWMGISLPTYKLTESGDRQPTPDEVAQFAYFSGLSVPILGSEMPLPNPLPLLPSLVLSSRGRPAKIITPAVDLPNQQRVKRIRQLINERFAGKARAFAQAIMVEETALSNFLAGRREISEKLILKIVRYVPGLSADWLRTGIGAPDQVFTPVVDYHHDGNRLAAYLDTQGLYWVDLQRAMGLKSLSSTVEYKKRESIRYQTKQRIAAALHVSVKDIFGC